MPNDFQPGRSSGTPDSHLHRTYDAIVIGSRISGGWAANELCEHGLQTLVLEQGRKDIAPWYSHVERFSGICGNKDGLEAMPDGDYLPPFDFNCVEKHLKQKISEHYPDRFMIQGRWAQLTKPNPIHLQQGRSQCQARD